MPTLYDAARCPYCARARIAIAEKGLDVETVLVDLDERPQFILDANPPHGRVPVIEVDGVLLPESRVIMGFLEERYPDPPLLPPDPIGRARVELALERFDRDLGTPYYRLYFGSPSGTEDAVVDCLARLDGRVAAEPYLVGDAFTMADIAYVPWVLRAEGRLGIRLDRFPSLERWVDRLAARPSIAAELAVVASL